MNDSKNLNTLVGVRLCQYNYTLERECFRVMNIFHEKMKRIVWIFQLSSEVGKYSPGYELMMTEDCNEGYFQLFAWLSIPFCFVRYIFELSASCFIQTRDKSKLQVRSEETIDRSIVKILE